MWNKDFQRSIVDIHLILYIQSGPFYSHLLNTLFTLVPEGKPVGIARPGSGVGDGNMDFITLTRHLFMAQWPSLESIWSV